MKTKKMFSKVFALLLALVTVLSMSVTVFAVDYTITINGAANGEKYTAYKVFDATVSGSGENAAVAYTISSTSSIYDEIKDFNGLTFTSSASDATVMVVTQDDSFDAAAFAQLLATKISSLTKAGETTAQNGTATISVSGEGYYFVDTNLGSLCSLETISGLNQTVYEKNSKPTITKKVAEDGTDITNYVDSTDIDIIDTIHYQLTVNTGTNSKGTGTGVDGNYVITDTLPAGVTIKIDNNNPFEVKVGETTWVKDTDYTVSTSNQVTTITLLSSGKLGSAPQNTNIVITYSATVTTKGSVNLTNTGNTNTATLTYKEQRGSDTAVVKTFKIGEDANGQKTFIKQDGKTEKVLAGVTFVLSRDSDEKKAVLDDNGFLTEWDTTGSQITTGADGSIVIKGVDSGDYTLTETSTLPGYNILTSTISVKVAEDGTVTYKNNGETNSTYENKITVDNNKGSELPSTGGIGTTIFYVIGSVMVAGALVLLVVKKRMSNYQD